jgi:general secretion pathway protein B
MSYILDALRRADAERQHGQVPGLNAAPSVPVRGASPLQGALRWWLLGLAVLCGVAALAAAGWWWGSRPAGSAAGQGGAVAALPMAAPAAVSGVGSSVPVPHTSAPPVPPAPAAPAPAAAALPPTLPVVVSAAPAPAIAAAAVVPPAATVAPPAPPPTPAADTTPKPLLLSALPPDQRRALPPLAVSGAVWSSSAASRFVMLDGQLVREGDTVVPGLVLERIHPKSAVLRWRDLRLELPL